MPLKDHSGNGRRDKGSNEYKECPMFNTRYGSSTRIEIKAKR